ncbi:MAG: type II toxin-antitoxin system prevent-host-death family antitoxin [Gammaproteobacteria bacterium]|nr:type II toxin-antitoxin system prevent-host-death family antitoxin [Gammaproteobacteria bacterium]
MDIFNIHEAKTHLSKLVERAARGEPFIIAKAGRPVAKVVAVDAPSTSAQLRVGFLTGEIAVPDDFDQMGSAEIERMFGVADDAAT